MHFEWRKQLLALDDFYLLHKLQGWCAILHYQTVNSVKIPVRFDKQLLEYLHQSHAENEPIIQAYYFILMSLLHPENESFFKQQKKYLTQQKHFDLDTLRSLYLYAINYCIRKIVAGNAKFYKEIFELYKSFIQNIFIDKNEFQVK